ncbi:hypothetical protein Zmor_020489 [Zophobas morio]|uniref:7tm 6 domain containing protein n=1 Tax=Zophobas morio TaxID=2755281 RepID=A0AA38I3N1_9CUCU|nr:hypothetical protein Zmor_020489 [Zophobas morio]
MAGGTVFLWAIYPILDGSVKQNSLPFRAWYPYDTTVSPFYETTYVYQIVSVAFIASTGITVDTLITALSEFIGAQCDILCDNIKNFYVEQQFSVGLLMKLK